MTQEQRDPNHKRFCAACRKYKDATQGGVVKRYWRCHECEEKAKRREHRRMT